MTCYQNSSCKCHNKECFLCPHYVHSFYDQLSPVALNFLLHTFHICMFFSFFLVEVPEGGLGTVLGQGMGSLIRGP